MKKKNLFLSIFLFVFCFLIGSVLSACSSEASANAAAAKTKELKIGETSYPEDLASFTGVLNADELAQLDAFPSLKEVNLSGSNCYDEILAWAETHPNVNVRWSVSIPEFGDSFASDITALDLSSVSGENTKKIVPFFRFFPKLETVDLGQERSALTAKDVASWIIEYPDISFLYSFSLAGSMYSISDTEIDLSFITDADVSAVADQLACMQNLQTVFLGDDQRENPLSWSSIRQLRSVCPNARFEYLFELYGFIFSLEDTAIDLNHIKIEDSGAHVREVIACMPNLEYLCMDSCGVSTEDMVSIRDDFPEVNVVWRISFGTNYSVRTDVTKILASKPSVGGYLTDDKFDILKYCTKVKYLDLGHNESLETLDFVRYMPDLEVLIIAMNPVSDLTPLADCPNLEYLEIFYTNVTDLSPLSNLHKLKHINIGMSNDLADISPLYCLSQLERLYIGCLTKVPEEQISEIAKRIPSCKIDFVSWDTSTGDWRFTNEFDNDKDYLSSGYYREGMHPRFALLREQFGYDKEAYSFSWLDPNF